MKLYYSPGACSLAPHIALSEAGIAFEGVKVDLGAHQIEGGGDYHAINPKGYVPFLVADDGLALSEAAVILQYIADRKPGSLAPQPGTAERYKLMEWLNFIATEVHKGFGPLWQANAPEATQQAARAKLAKRFDLIAKQLDGRQYLTGDAFTIADAYLFTVVNWSGMLGVDLSPWPALQSFMARVAARPKVRAALVDEGLVKQASGEEVTA
jgi:glutathione S-transferase